MLWACFNTRLIVHICIMARSGRFNPHRHGVIVLRLNLLFGLHNCRLHLFKRISCLAKLFARAIDKFGLNMLCCRGSRATLLAIDVLCMFRSTMLLLGPKWRFLYCGGYISSCLRNKRRWLIYYLWRFDCYSTIAFR